MLKDKIIFYVGNEPACFSQYLIEKLQKKFELYQVVTSFYVVPTNGVKMFSVYSFDLKEIMRNVKNVIFFESLLRDDFSSLFTIPALNYVCENNIDFDFYDAIPHIADNCLKLILFEKNSAKDINDIIKKY